jgi:hypothetical protein
MWPHYGRLLAASYTTAAQIVTIRLLIRNRLAELDPAQCEQLLAETRRSVMSVLDPAVPLPTSSPTDEDQIADAAAETFEILLLRCAEVRQAARELRRLADEKWITPA